ncbi:HD domain-containing protein [Sphingobacterium spiritivorum]|uniref:HD domain-containing protein n=1 Tax=Sphingobacterium spiritivorum TaxID=258 RepID=UPI003DA36358
MSQLIESVKNYILDFLQEKLSSDLVFHNLAHTREVVNAAYEIGENSGLDKSEMEILIVAAWFHDCGYAYTYTGHEEESKKIAADFLKKSTVNTEFINSVLACIEATKFPQCPKNRIEMALCDADLLHLTKTSYPRYAHAIRTEFEIFLHQAYSDAEWNAVNCAMLLNHNYWTKYGQNILKRFKEVNIELMGCNCSDMG